MSILVQTQPKSPLAPTYLMLAIIIASIGFWSDELSLEANILQIGVIALFIASILFYINPFQWLAKVILWRLGKGQLVESSTDYKATFDSIYLEEMRNNIYGLSYFIMAVIITLKYQPFFVLGLNSTLLTLVLIILFSVLVYQLVLLRPRLRNTQQYYVLFSERNKFKIDRFSSPDIITNLEALDSLLEGLQNALTQKEWKTVEELSKDRLEDLHIVLETLINHLKESNMILRGKEISNKIQEGYLKSLENVKKVKEYYIQRAEETIIVADALCFKYVNKIGETLRNELDRILEKHQLFYLDLFTLTTEVFITLEILGMRDEFKPKNNVAFLTNDDIIKVRLCALYDLIGIKKNSKSILKNESQKLVYDLLKSETSIPNGKTWVEFEKDTKAFLEQGKKVAEETETFFEKVEKFRKKCLTS